VPLVGLYDRPVTLKVIGCILFGHRWVSATDGALPTTQLGVMPGGTFGISAPTSAATDTVVTCRWCGRREVLPPGTSIVEWRSYHGIGSRGIGGGSRS